MRLKSFDNYLIATMSFAALICLYMLYGARYFAHSSSSEIRIASIIEQVKTVKRKRDFYQSWMDVGPNEGLAQNDEIYTHGQSSAKIHFENGPEITLFENSLLRIKSLKKGNTLSLERGNLSAKLTPESSKLDVVLSGKKYSFESQSANIQIEQGKTENKFLLLEGKAKLKNDSAEAAPGQEIEANQVLIQNKITGSLKIKAIPFVMNLPMQNSSSYFVDKKNVSFSWKFTGTPIPVEFIVAKTSAFNRADIIKKEVIDSNQHEREILFDKSGTYYWKLATIDQEKTNIIDSPIRSFTLTREKPLNLNIDKALLYVGPKKAERVFLNWNKENAKNFEMRITHPDKTKEVILLTKNNYEYSATQLGNTTFEVKIKDEEKRPEALWSEPVTLEVLEAKSITISSLSPESLERINYSKSTGAINQILSWNGPTSDVTYTIKLTRLADKIATTFSTENTSYPVPLTSSGEYLWEIAGETSSGVTTNKISGKINLKAPMNISQLPAEGAVIELEKPDQLVTFKWEEVDGANYQFELSNEPGFQKVLYEKDITQTSISTTLGQTGKYFWRVKVKKGNSFEYSAPVSVEIKATAPLGRPDVSPNIKIKLKYLDDKTSRLDRRTPMPFHWLDLFFSAALAETETKPAQVAVAEWDLPANLRAKNYIVEIYQDAGLKKLLTKIESSTPHIIWKNAGSGTFYWRVSYEDFWGRKTEFSKVSTLETEIDPDLLALEKAKEKEKLTPLPIELIRPKHRESILQNNDNENEVAEYEFSWEKIPNTKIYQVSIAEDLEFERIQLKTKVANTSLTLHCKDLGEKESDFYWRVNTEEGSISKRRQFHSLCAPKKEVVSEKIAPPEVEKKKERPAHFWRVGYLPHSISYDNKSTGYSAKVSGTVINSWYGMYQTPVEWKYFSIFNSALSISRGKVFKTETFTDMELNFKAFKKQTSFSWGPVFAIIKKTLYVESSLAISSAGQTSPLAGLFIQKNFASVSLNAEAKFGGALDLHADMLIDVKKNIMAGPFFDTTSITKEGGKHTFSRIGLNVNYTFSK